jgi:hypothetical protein
MTAAWRPSVGAWPEGSGVSFRVWAPAARSVDLVLDAAHPGSAVALTHDPDSCFITTLTAAGPGTRYLYRTDGKGGTFRGRHGLVLDLLIRHDCPPEEVASSGRSRCRPKLTSCIPARGTQERTENGTGFEGTTRFNLKCFRVFTSWIEELPASITYPASIASLPVMGIL